jgi:serine protease AprX
VQVRLDGQSGSLDDTNGHGTLVAAIAAGQSKDGHFVGVAPGASIYAINVSRPDGVHTSDVITGLKWVYDNAHADNIRVVNLSLAETVASSYRQSPLDLAVERLWAAGVVVVGAAGNLGETAGAVDFAPANDPLAITVGALDPNATTSMGDDFVAPFSSRGTTMDGFAKPELLAPGRLIASLLPAGSYLDAQAPAANRVAPGYASISGTSFAAPQVAAAAALIFQLNPGLSPDQVKWLLLKNGRTLTGGTGLAMNLSFLSSSVGTPLAANQGVPALVCAPGASCLPDDGTSTVASSWSSASWNSASWNSASWNSASWNSASWNSASWNSASWNSASWNSASWNSASWNFNSWQ